MSKHQPATPLPWWHFQPYGDMPGIFHIATENNRTALGEVCSLYGQQTNADAAYIAHAANAYPKLVEALQSALSASKGDWQKGMSWDRAASKLLRDLGELE
jgi:hypothetical protein